MSIFGGVSISPRLGRRSGFSSLCPAVTSTGRVGGDYRHGANLSKIRQPPTGVFFFGGGFGVRLG